MIVASAILYPNGEIVTSRRHYQIIAIQAKLGISSAQAIQGFVDHTGKFYTREDAKLVAVENNQVPKSHSGILYSEDIWPPTSAGQS